MGHVITTPSFFCKYIVYVYALYSIVFYCSYNVVGVPKSPNGYIIGKVHLTPLTSITHLIPLFKMEDQEEFYSVMVGTMFVPYKIATTDLYTRECS